MLLKVSDKMMNAYKALNVNDIPGKPILGLALMVLQTMNLR